MLIVSQNKMKTTEKMEIWIEELWENTEFNKKSFYIKNPIGTLGRYHTEERAKEVLQEIINAYKGKCLIQFKGAISEEQMTKIQEKFGQDKIFFDSRSEIKQLNNTVYEMPEE